MELLIKYGLEILLGFLSTATIYLFKKIGEYRKKIISINKSVQLLLKDQIVEIYHDTKRKGNISIFDKETITDLYRVYQDMGGGGLVDQLMKEIDNMPIIRCGGE